MELNQAISLMVTSTTHLKPCMRLATEIEVEKLIKLTVNKITEDEEGDNEGNPYLFLEDDKSNRVIDTYETTKESQWFIDDTHPKINSIMRVLKELNVTEDGESHEDYGIFLLTTDKAFSKSKEIGAIF
jgi:hypothetical protein